MSSLLVTGAAGFIGSHLAEAAAKSGWDVVGLDNFDAFYDRESKVRNVKPVMTHPRFEFVEGDIRDEALIRDLMRSRGFGAIAHLAAVPGVGPSVDDPRRYVDVNQNGTITLLSAAAESPEDPLFVFASSSSVYGKSGTVPFRESDPADTPLAPYPATKRSGEMIGHAFHHVHGVDFTALRFFTVYGPRNRPDMMAYRLVDAALTGRPVRMHAGGSMERDFTFVSDIVAGVLAALERRLGYEVVNLGSGRATSITQLKDEVERATERDIATEEAPAPRTDVSRTWADISKAKRLLDFAPATPLAEGVAALVDDVRTLREGKSEHHVEPL